jgi:hypothetical protein
MVSTTATMYVMSGIKKLNLDLIDIEKKFETRQDLKQAEELEFNYDLEIENEIERVNKLFNKNVHSNTSNNSIMLMNSPIFQILNK